MTLRTGVIGCGYFGSLHAQRMARLPGSSLVAVVDADPARAAALATRLGCAAAASHRDLIGRVDAVSVAVPAARLAEVAADLVEAGIHVLVEKPMATSLAAARDLVARAAAAGAVLQVGFVEAFSAPWRALAAEVRDPVYIQANRIGPWKGRVAATDVILDMMIHDIDLVLRLVPSEVVRIEALGAGVVGAAEDLANARVTFADGTVADLGASRMASRTERVLRVFEPGRYLTCDFAAGVLTTAQPATDPAALVAEPIGRTALTIERSDNLDAEIGAFLAAAAARTAPPVDGARGLAALQVALAIREEARSHRALIAARRARRADQGTERRAVK